MAGFEERIEDFDAAGVQIVAISADDAEDARKMKDAEGVSFPIAVDLDVDEAEEVLGVYVARGERTHVQPAQFVLRPDGTVAFASYSSDKVGRLRADEALEEVQSLQEAASAVASD